MAETMKKAYDDFVMELFSIASNTFQDSLRYREYDQLYTQNKERLIELVPQEKRSQARQYLDDISYGENLEIDYYYSHGVHDGIQLLKLLGAI